MKCERRKISSWQLMFDHQKIEESLFGLPMTWPRNSNRLLSYLAERNPN